MGMESGTATALVGEREAWAPPAWTRQRAATVDAHGRRNVATVLVVDDNEAVRVSVAEVLRFVGYTVIESSHGVDAFRLLRVMRFDAMVLDLRMPYLDGPSLLAALPKAPPVIILSAYEPSGDDVRGGLKRWVIRWLKKPVPVHELLDTVAAVLDAPSP